MIPAARTTQRLLFMGIAIVLATGLGIYFWPRPPAPSEALVTNHEHLSRLAQNYNGRTAYDHLLASGNVQAAQEEAQRLATWKRSFPWKPTTDPDVKFDPIRHVRQGPLPGERNGFVDNTVSRYHVFLKRFFQNEARFSAQFEQMYRILEDHNRPNNPVLTGYLFQYLWSYHQMRQHDPNDTALEARMATTRWVNPLTNESQSETRLDGWEVVRDVQTGRALTWGDEADRYAESMLGALSDPEWLLPLDDRSEPEVEFIRYRLIHEIQGMDSIPHPRMYGEISPEEKTLGKDYLSLMREGRPVGGDEILVPYVGWVQEYREYEDKFYARLNHSIATGDPSLKTIRPDLFPPNGVKNNRLVDQHGDPVRAHPGFAATMITENREPIPLRPNEDGSIRLPTPTEIETMRSN